MNHHPLPGTAVLSRIGPLVAAAAIVLAACSSSTGATAPAPASSAASSSAAGTTSAKGGYGYGGATSAPSASAAAGGATGGSTASIIDFGFTPASITVKTGTSVTWKNTGGVTHTVTADDGSFDSGPVATGSTFSETFAKTGTFTYHCKIHPSMKGTVTVTP